VRARAPGPDDGVALLWALAVVMLIVGPAGGSTNAQPEDGGFDPRGRDGKDLQSSCCPQRRQ
jgi:hypothetical protein